MKSIMYHERDECFICHRQTALETHHIWHGTANRRFSDADGLTVNLCPECHRAIHEKGVNDYLLMIQAQVEWMMLHDFTAEDFRKRYGRSLL